MATGKPYFTASCRRIQSAINYLQKQGITNIVLIGHGLGAAAAAMYVSGNDFLEVSGLAAISLGVPPGSEPKSYGPGLLEKIHVPILDIYGSIISWQLKSKTPSTGDGVCIHQEF